MSHESILKEFRGILDQNTRTAACRREFVLVEKLQHWLRSSFDGKVTHVERLVRVAYEDRHTPFLPIAPHNISNPGDNCCLLVFCILQRIGCGSAIDVFYETQNTDRRLPMRLDTIQETFHSAEIQDRNKAFQFFDLQHRFKPARFDWQMKGVWDSNTVIPICQKLPIKKGGTAQIYQIDVPEEFVGEKLRSVCAGSRFNAASEESPDWRYQFALKTFDHSHKSCYVNEMNAFLGLVHHEGMVRWLANYTQTHDHPAGQVALGPSKQETTTYNILLEFGEMDLRVYFEEVLPPVLPSEIEAFWRSLFEIADAVRGIHNLKVRIAEQMVEFYGWHTDIKPDNILFVEDRIIPDNPRDSWVHSKLEKDQNKFKLADPGFAKFVKKSPKEPCDVPRQHLQGGTETYGAPEYPGRSDKPVSQAIDIWSLGCVFSLAATWIILGQTGVIQYEAVRQLATKKLVQTRRNKNLALNQVGEVSEGDQFHDGRDVLEAVTHWHQYLRNSHRRTDTITPTVLDLVDQEMLLGHADRRTRASDLCSKLECILQRCHSNTEPQLPEYLVGLLGEVDMDASFKASNMRRSRHVAKASSTSSNTVTRDVQHSNPAEGPLKTTHRQSFWPNQNLRLHNGKEPENHGLRLQTISEQPHKYYETSLTPVESTNHHRMSLNSIHSTPSRPRRPRAKKHRPQNYFQAREDLQKREAEWKMEFYKPSKYRKHDSKDGLLTSYFRGMRDIIFLVDNAESMGENWYEATELLDVLVKKAKGLDDDGMDLRFTTGNITLDGENSASKFRNKMNAARPKMRSKERARTDLRSALGNILHDYIDRLKKQDNHPSTKVKDTVLLILTDGIWAGMENKNDVAEQIKKFSKELKDRQYDLKLRPFSFEFIQFGNNEDATQRLRYLDDYLHKEGIPDIIDTEHSSGDVNKMLLGSFVEEYDMDEGDDLSPFTRPGSNYSTSERAMSPESYFGNSSSNPNIQSQAVSRSTLGLRQSSHGSALPELDSFRNDSLGSNHFY